MRIVPGSPTSTRATSSGAEGLADGHEEGRTDAGRAVAHAPREGDLSAAREVPRPDGRGGTIAPPVRGSTLLAGSAGAVPGARSLIVREIRRRLRRRGISRGRDTGAPARRERRRGRAVRHPVELPRRGAPAADRHRAAAQAPPGRRARDASTSSASRSGTRTSIRSTPPSSASSRRTGRTPTTTTCAGSRSGCSSGSPTRVGELLPNAPEAARAAERFRPPFATLDFVEALERRAGSPTCSRKDREELRALARQGGLDGSRQLLERHVPRQVVRALRRARRSTG